MKNKVLIFGSSGLLGAEFVDFLSKDKEYILFKYNSKNSDISDYDKVFKIISKIRPDIVINCAAKVNIDICEAEPLGTLVVNSVGPGNIAQSLKLLKKKAIFLHISTSDIFGGEIPVGYHETAPAGPLNVYSWSKLVGEKNIELELRDNKNITYFIARTGWLYGGNRKTFIDSIVDSLLNNKSLDLVCDQYSVPTWTRDLVERAVQLIKNKKFQSGIYHLTNSYEKPVSKYEVGLYIAKVLGCSSSPIKKASYKVIFKTDRPKNTALKNSKIKPLPDWRKSVTEFINFKYKKYFNL